MVMFFFWCLKIILVEGNNESQEHKWRSMKQENEELKKRLRVMKEELEDKDSELEQREGLINALLVKERYANDEILEAQKLLISVCIEMISVFLTDLLFVGFTTLFFCCSK
jgi:hypothetical protein